MFNQKIHFKCLDTMIYYCREQKIICNKLLMKYRNHVDIKTRDFTSTDAKFLGNCVNHLAKFNTCILPHHLYALLSKFLPICK